MDFKDTVHLPRTDFPMRAALAEREPKQIAAWTADGLYEKTVARNVGKEPFVFHDGPPYANGEIHTGHFLNKILKDFVTKFFAMSGRLVDFVPGWDCHGLPIELQVDKQLGAKKRELTPAQFRRACRAYAEEQVKLQREQFKRLGVFARWDDPYLTMSYDYEAQTVRELAAIARKGALYRRKRPVHWCGKDQTALAEAEVEYADKVSPSIYVAFDAVDASALTKVVPQLAGKRLSLVAWTTTPWTIPANLAIAAGPEIDYVAYDLAGRALVVAKDLLTSFLKDCAPGELADAAGPNDLVGAAREAARAPALKDHAKVLAHFTGLDLAGVTYRHPLLARQGPVLMAEHATTETGTGLVHTAPGHGEDDFRLGVAHGLPIFAPVDGAGRFTHEVGIEGLTGVKVFEANGLVVQKLHAAGALLNRTGAAFDITHSYPHCWRCKQPVIFRATDQWWIGMDVEVEHGGETTTIRKLALDAIDRLAAAGGWVPAWGRDRIRGMVENRPDWCVSRQRAWGVPIPVAYCKADGEALLSADAMEHVAKIFEKEGADAWFDRPLSTLLPEGSKCPKCGGTDFEKENDILDVWFDSGSSFAAVLMSGRWKHVRAPADLYLEGSDQHRGWFNSSLTIGVAAHGASPYKQVLTHGFVVDAEGRKLSKSLGNLGGPQQMLQKYGAEVVRLWVAASDYREDIRLSTVILDKLSEGYRKIRNTLRYCLSQLHDFDPALHAVKPELLQPLDRWALSKLERWRAQVEEAYRAYEFHRIYHATVEFCATDLSAVYFDALKDRTYCSGKEWPERRAAQTTLLTIADTLCRMLAPMASFTAEEAWAHLPKAGRAPSVFLAGLPEARPHAIDETLEKEFLYLLSFREAVNARLEAKRAAKELGKATEASVTLVLSPEAAGGSAGGAANKHLSWLPDLFLCARVHLETAELEEGKSCDARVAKSTFTPCERCWRALADVGEDKAHPTLCGRCARAVKGS